MLCSDIINIMIEYLPISSYLNFTATSPFYYHTYYHETRKIYSYIRLHTDISCKMYKHLSIQFITKCVSNEHILVLDWVVKKQYSTYGSIHDIAINNNSLKVIIWLLECGYPPRESTLLFLIRRNSITNIRKYYNENTIIYQSQILRQAIYYDNIDIFDLLLSYGCHCNSFVFHAIIVENNLIMMESLINNRGLQDLSLEIPSLKYALNKKYYSMIRLLLEEHTKTNETRLEIPSSFYKTVVTDMNMLLLFATHCLPNSPLDNIITSTEMIIFGNLTLLQHLYSYGVELHHNICKLAAQYNRYDILIWATSLNCPKTTGVCNEFIKQNNIDMFVWSKMNGYPHNKNFKTLLKKNKQFKFLDKVNKLGY